MAEQARILLVKINPPEFMNIPPLGLLYVGDALKKAGYKVQVLHISTEKVDEYVEKVIETAPIYVGFSVFTGTTMRAYADMCRKIKKLSDIPIVWGNAHPSLLPEQCLQETYIDYVVIGEGEVTAVELAEALQGKRDLREVKGIGYKKNGESIITDPRPFIENLDDYCLDWSLVNVEQYLRSFGEVDRMIHFVTSRGCPHRCGFCYNKRFNKRKWRAHSIDFVVSHLNRFKEQYHIGGIIFWDDEFIVNKQRALSIVEKVGLPYYCHCRIEYIDDEFARQLAETGCRYLLIGFESGSDRVLKLITKDSTVSDISAGVRALANYPSVEVSGSIIFGFPTETRDEFRSTLRVITELLDIKNNMNFTTGWYIPYPGSDLYDLALQHGFHPPRRTEDWEDLDRWADKFEITWVDWLSSTEAAEVRKNVRFLAALYRYNIPLLRNIVRKQILARDGQLGVVARGIRRGFERFFDGGSGFFSHIGHFALRVIWKTRQLIGQR